MIEIITGKQGAGKSYWLVRKCIRYMKRGRLVFSDTPIYVKHHGKILSPAILTREMIRDFRFPEGSFIAIHEGGGWFNSRSYKDKLAENENAFTLDDFIIFTQGRHIGIDVTVLAPDYEMLDINIRRVAHKTWVIEKFPDFGDKVPGLIHIGTCYYCASDVMNRFPMYKPGKSIVLFRRKIARCYDTQYQRNILNKRKNVEFDRWSLEHYQDTTIIAKVKRWLLSRKPKKAFSVH